MLQPRLFETLCATAFLIASAHALPAGDAQLVAHWKLDSDAQDSSGNGNHGKIHDVKFEATGEDNAFSHAARFSGTGSYIEVPNSKSLTLGTEDFSLSVWLHTDSELDDVIGDIASKFDPATRKGLNFGVQTLAGVTSAQSNSRNVYFGMDNGKIDPKWTDCGRLGNSMYVFSLCVYDGQLFASTFEMNKDQAGHVFRYAGGDQWVDCGSPDRCNAVEALCVYNGKLYAGAARYLSAGSALPESPNEIPGGKVYRYEGDNNWVDCGKLQNPETGEAFTVGGMVVYRGRLYAGVSKPAGKGFYRYEGGQEWTYCGNPGHRPTNPVVYNGNIYVCSLDGGGVSRFDGTTWTDLGKPKGVTQTYGFAIHRGELYASSWPTAEVFRYGGEKNWQTTGPLGSEKESMGMAVYNGMLYAGTLPLAEVYRYDGGETWTRTGQLDTTPDVRYRRAWSMAVFQGKLFCGTCPSGRVFSIEAGKNVTDDRELGPGWHHLSVVKRGGELSLYRDGKLAASSGKFDPAAFDISNDKPLTIGFGAHDYFKGSLRDLRIYRGAVAESEVAALSKRP